MSGTKLKIIRGKDQIGGNLISLSFGGTRLLLDAGDDLEGSGVIPPQAEMLTRSGGADGILLTHYHRDHIGLAYQAAEDIPVYLGRKTWEIQSAADRYMGREPLRPAGLWEDGRSFSIGPFTITPYLCDHSAFDSYMLLVEWEGKSLLYTGDFRGHGRKSFPALLKRLPHQVDVLVCEGTNLSRPEAGFWSEKELEERAAALLKETAGPAFVLLSAANLDRVVSFYRAAKRTGRRFLEDLYLAEVASAAGGHIPRPGAFEDVGVFLPRGYDRNHPRYQRFATYGKARMGRGKIPAKSVICVRPSMLPWLRKLAERMPMKDGVLCYSMWSGYRKKREVAEFLSAGGGLELREVTLHTSGHAGGAEIGALCRQVRPRVGVVPVHTEASASIGEWCGAYPVLFQTELRW